MRALSRTYVINSIYVDSCIHEDPGYLLIAMKCCVMKAIHLLLRDTSEEMGISQGFFSEAAVVIDYPQRSLCFPPARTPCPHTDKFIEMVSTAKPVPGSFTRLFVQSHVYFSLVSLCYFLSAGLHIALPDNGCPPWEVTGLGKSPQISVWKWNHLHGANLGFGIDIGTCFQEQLHTVAVTPLSSQVQSCKSFLDKAKKETSSISVDKAKTEQHHEQASTLSPESMTY